jgi:hypothetical protein
VCFDKMRVELTFHIQKIIFQALERNNQFEREIWLSEATSSGVNIKKPFPLVSDGVEE